MNLDDIRIFNQVAAAGSFTAAAKILGLPKSTVSRRVAELEDALGVTLLKRTTRKLGLTEAGELYFEKTSRALGELRDAEHAVEDLQSEPKGLLRITIPGDLNGTLPGLIREFQEKYPLIDLVVFATARRVDLVAEGYDLALRAGTSQLDDSSLRSRRLLSSTIRLFASPTYLARAGTPEHPEDLVRHQCLIFSNDETQTVWRLLAAEGEVSVPVKGRLASRDFSLLRAVAAAGLGIAALPELALVGMRGQLVGVLPQFTLDQSGLYAVYPEGKYVPNKVRVFIDFASVWMTERMTAAIASCSEQGP